MLCQLGAQHFMAGQAVLPAVQSDMKSLQAFPVNSSLKEYEFYHFTVCHAETTTKDSTLGLYMEKGF